MNKVTIENVMSWHPCAEYTKERITELFSGRESLTVLDIIELDIPAEDRLWAVLREELIPTNILHEFACRCAEEALKSIENPDKRSIAAIEAKRKWIKGEITKVELDAAGKAAWAAAEGAAAWAAAEGAAVLAAARAAAEGAAAGAEQIEILKELLGVA